MFSDDKGILKAGKILQIYKAQSTNTLKMVETLFHKNCYVTRSHKNDD